MSQENQDLYFKYSSVVSSDKKMKISGYCFEGETSVHDFGYIPLPQGKIRVLLCKCGANNWTDNGRFINEYECDCCGKFVEVYEKKEIA